MKKNKLERSICFDEIIAGAMQHFEAIDFIDIKLFSDELKNHDVGDVREILWFWGGLDDYLYMSKEGCILFKPNFNIYSEVSYGEESIKTVGDMLRAKSTDEVNYYFDNLDIEAFNKKKEELLSKHRNKMLEEGNILLISDNDEDYNELKKYGFKNVDRFKSLIRAERFFDACPEYLDKYQIIIEGNQALRDIWYLGSECNLPEKIRSKRHQLTTTTLNEYDFSTKPRFVTLLNYEASNWDLNMQSNSRFEAFDKILNVAFVNESLKKKDNKKYYPLVDSYNCNRFLPKRKEDLKILYLVSLPMETDITENIKKLGLNVDIRDDNNFGISRNVKNNLGDYDIILATNRFSWNLINLSCESTEQCKDTGRKLTLLVVYKNERDCIVDENKESRQTFLGDKIILDYTFGGELSNNLEKRNQKTFNAITNYDRDADIYWFEKYQKCSKVIAEVRIQEAVNIYNQSLIKTGNKALEGLDLKTAEEFDKEYEEELNKEMERINIALKPIKKINEVRDIVSSYLRNKKNGLALEKIEGLEIIEQDNGIRIINIENGKTMGAITLSRDKKQENMVVFAVETPVIEEDTLLPPEIIYMTKPELVSFYTSKFEGLENTPKRPNEQQLKVIETLEEKIKTTVEPININATKQLLEIVNYEPADKVESKKEGFLKRLFKSKK